jgi:hypothetical protein
VRALAIQERAMASGLVPGATTQNHAASHRRVHRHIDRYGYPQNVDAAILIRGAADPAPSEPRTAPATT